MALVDVRLRIGRGITGLLGPNGAGKTPLIKVLLGLVRIDSGRGSVLGCPIGQAAHAIRQQVGYMPEDDCYIPGLSGVETVQLGARLSGLPRRKALRRAHEILEFCGLKEERYRQTVTYSLGMRQKLKFVLAIVHDPPLLILDEPTSGLDPLEREEMLSRIQVLAGRFGKAVVLSTHILPDVQAICEEVIILAGGWVRLCGKLAELNRPAQAAYWVQTLGPAGPLVEWDQNHGLPLLVSNDRLLQLATNDPQLLQRLWQGAEQTGVVIRSLHPAQKLPGNHLSRSTPGDRLCPFMTWGIGLGKVRARLDGLDGGPSANQASKRLAKCMDTSAFGGSLATGLLFRLSLFHLRTVGQTYRRFHHPAVGPKKPPFPQEAEDSFKPLLRQALAGQPIEQLPPVQQAMVRMVFQILQPQLDHLLQQAQARLEAILPGVPKTLDRHTIWCWLMGTFFRYPQGVVMMLLVGLLAPPLIARDISSKAFLVYFSRPIRWSDYLGGKLQILWIYLGLVTLGHP
ncbi:MAG: ABC transporter ATP-binding protein [Thermoguttaceae bacterium]|nr:ABC transporter ATP-binding protein [Thermoguttaceae bacterium]